VEYPKLKMANKKQKFRIGGIQECMVLAIFLDVGYLGIAVMHPKSNLPLVPSGISEVFATFFLLVPTMFAGLSALELLWFERDLTWSGRKKKEGISPPKAKAMGIRDARFI